MKDSGIGSLMVISVEPLNILWNDIETIGICDTSDLDTCVTAGDRITVIYMPRNQLLKTMET